MVYLMNVSLRPVEADDHPFLYELYCSTRQEELAAWGWDAAQTAICGVLASGMDETIRCQNTQPKSATCSS